MKRVVSFVLTVLLTLPALAQEGATERIVVPFSNPGRPGTLIVSAPASQIVVVGYDGQEAIFETREAAMTSRRDERRMRWDERADDRRQGLRRLRQPARGLDIEESNNEMHVQLGGWAMNDEASVLHIRVPRATSLHIETMNGGDLRIEGVRGQHEINNLNGDVLLQNIGGSAVVSALNGDITATFTSIAADMPMSFSSMNGDIDVTFPASLRADLILKTQQGEIFTDFDVRLDTAPRLDVDDDRDDGVYRVQVDDTLYGTVNGGGPEIRLKTFNADIFIRKAN